MVDKLTGAMPLGTAVSPGSTSVRAPSRIQPARRFSVQSSSLGGGPQFKLNGHLAQGATIGIHTTTLNPQPAPPERVDAVAERSISAQQKLQTLIDRVKPDDSLQSQEREEALKFTTYLLSKGCKWNEALSFIEMLRKKEISLNVITYGALMGRANCEFDRKQASIKVLEIYDDMLKHEVHPNLRVCTTIITALGRQGRPDDAEKVFRVMEKRGDRADYKAFGALMSAYAAKGDNQAIKAVQRLYKELIQCGHGGHAYLLDNWLLTLAKADREWPPVRGML